MPSEAWSTSDRMFLQTFSFISFIYKEGKNSMYFKKSLILVHTRVGQYRSLLHSSVVSIWTH